MIRRKLILDLEADAAKASARAVAAANRQATQSATTGVQFAASLLRRKYRYNRIEARRLTEGLNIDPQCAIYCEHAHECRTICHCPPWCYCRVNGCCKDDRYYQWEQKDGTVVFEFKTSTCVHIPHNLDKVRVVVRQEDSERTNPPTVSTSHGITVVKFVSATAGIIYIEKQ